MAITHVGSTAGSATDGGNVTLTLPAGIQPGDVVYVAGGVGSDGSGFNPTISGYTRLILNNTGGSSRVQGAVFRKVMGATPDASVVCPGNGGNKATTAYCAYTLRGVDTTTPEDTSVVEATATTGAPNAASILTATPGAWVLPLVLQVGRNGFSAAPSGYANLQSAGNNDTVEASAGGSTKEVVSAGTEDPGAYTTTNNGHWLAWTVAVRPAGGAGNQTVTPSPVVLKALAAAPTLQAGGVTLTPGAAAARLQIAAPTIASVVTVTPGAAVARFQIAAPTLVAGGAILAPGAAVARLLIGSPTLAMGALTLTPGAAVARLLIGAPTVTLGAILLTPGSALVRAGVAAPTLVLGGVVLAPGSVLARFAVAAPTVSSGSEPQTVTPSAVLAWMRAAAPTLVDGGVILLPDPVLARMLVGAPTLQMGAAILAPDAVVAALLIGSPVVSGGEQAPGGSGRHSRGGVIRWAARRRGSVIFIGYIGE